MTLRGAGIVIMWHDITPEGDAAYNLWHTREHMPERIALPGFHRARRGVNKALDRQHYFTLYECADLGSTVSPEYRRSLDFPTAWTQQVAPDFRNFKRAACQTRFSRGQGLGGAVATFRAGMACDPDMAALAGVLEAILTVPSIICVHVAVPQPEFSSGETTEVKIRPVMSEPDFALVVIVEGIGLAEITADQPEITRLLIRHGLRDIIAQAYDMAYMLEEVSPA